jgi:hypothetical protein
MSKFDTNNLSLSEIADHLEDIMQSEGFLGAWESMKKLSKTSKPSLKLTCAAYFYFGLNSGIQATLFDKTESINIMPL